MSNWQKDLKTIPIDWLLEEENPSIRYFTQIELLGLQQNNHEVIRTKKRINNSLLVKEILYNQKENRYWGKEKGYLKRYIGTAWQILLLLELGCDPLLQQIQNAANYILEVGFDHKQQCFLNWKGLPQPPCYHGVLLNIFLRCQLENDLRVQALIDWVINNIEFHDGEDDVKNPDDMCLGKHNCIRGVVPIIDAMSKIQSTMITEKIDAFLRCGNEFLLKHYVFKRSHDISRVISPYMTKLTFPSFYYPDALHILLLLLNQNYHDKRMKLSIELIKKKQGKDGKWILQRPYNERRINDVFQVFVNIEKKNEPSKWLTLRSLIAFKKWNDVE